MVFKEVTSIEMVSIRTNDVRC